MSSNDNVTKLIQKSLVESETFNPADELGAPMPLQALLEEAAKFPVKELGDILRNTVKGIVDIVRVPDALAAQSILAAVSLTTQAHIKVRLHTGKVFPSSLYLATVGKTGDRKSSSDEKTLEAIEAFEKQWCLSNKAARVAYENRLEIYKEAKKTILKHPENTPEQKTKALEQLGEPPLAPVEPVLLSPEPTAEGIQKYFAKGSPTLGLMSDEGGQFLNGYAMNKDNRLKTVTFFSDVWGGKPIKRMRGEDGTTTLYGKVLTIHMLMQPDIGASLFADKQLENQGFLSRLLCAAPDSIMGERKNLTHKKSPLSFTYIKYFNDRISLILNLLITEEEPHVDKKQEAKKAFRGDIEPKIIDISPEVIHAFDVFNDEIEDNIKKGGIWESISGFACKLNEHALRIAANLAFFEEYEKMELATPEINYFLSVDYFKRGVAIARYYASEALRLFGKAATPLYLQQAHDLLQILLKKWDEDYVSLVEIYQNKWAGIRTKQQGKKIMDILCDHRWVEFHKEKINIQGNIRLNSYRLRREYFKEDYFRLTLENFRTTLEHSENEEKAPAEPQDIRVLETVEQPTLETLETLEGGQEKNFLFEPLAPTKPPVSYTLITNLKEALTALQKVVEQGDLVGLDIETTGLHPWNGAKARLLQISTSSDEPVIIIDLFAIGGLEQLKEPLEKIQAVAHNALFEMSFFKQAGINLIPDCTLLAEHVLTGKTLTKKGVLDFKTICQQHLNITLDKELQKSDWSGELTDEQLLYAAKDAFYVRQLFHKIKPLLEQRNSLNIYNTVKEAQPAVVAMHAKGIGFDVEAHTSLLNQITQEKEAHEAELVKLFPNINIDSNKQLGEWLKTALGGEESENYQKWGRTKTGQLETGEEAFREYSHLLSEEVQTSISQSVLPYKEKSKQINAFGESLASEVSPVTLRIHASFNMAGTKTGRFSCRSPNLQQIPRDKRFRNLFKPSEASVYVIADYSQMELRVAAIITNETNLLEAYEKGVDVHILTASKLLKKPIEAITKEERQLAKAVNFGLLYGQGAKGLKKYAATSYGVEMSEKEAEKHIKAWFKAYPNIALWHKIQGTRSYLDRVVTTPLGRKRFFNDKDDYRSTRAFNTPIQGGAAEVLLKALPLLMNNLKGIDAAPIAVIHDEIIVEAAIQEAEQAQIALKLAMEQGMLAVFPQATIKDLVDVKKASSWGDK